MHKYFNKDNHDIADFLIRFALAIIFIRHGFGKLHDMAGTIKFFSSIGLPEVFAYLVGVTEFAGGILMLLGAWTTQIAWLFVVIMIGAIAFVKGQKGFSASELELTLLIASLAVAYLPIGKYTYKKLLGRG